MPRLRSSVLMFFSAISLQSHAFNISAKQHVTGPAIHSTYFMTVNNRPENIKAKAYAGQYINGICDYNAVYDLGHEQLKTGDTVYIDAFALKLLIGTQFTCMSIYYNNQQVSIESFQLISDGINYIATFPPTAQLTVT